jgi:hypothetical protein
LIHPDNVSVTFTGLSTTTHCVHQSGTYAMLLTWL